MFLGKHWAEFVNSQRLVVVTQQFWPVIGMVSGRLATNPFHDEI